MEAKVEYQQVKCLVDSGANISCINQYILHCVKPNAIVQKSKITSGIGVCGEVHSILGTTLELMFGDHKIQQTFHIFETLHAKVILGLDFLRDNKVKTDFENMKLQFPISKHRNCYVYNEHLSHITVSTFQESSIEIAMAETISEAILEPHSQTIIPVKIPKFRTVILEPQQNLSQNLGVAGEKTVPCIDQGIGTNRLMNPANFPVYLHPRCRIAKAQPIDKYCIHTLEESNSTNLFSVSDNNVKSDDHYKKILLDLGINLDNTEITSEQKTRLCQLLGQNRDIFPKIYQS